MEVTRTNWSEVEAILRHSVLDEVMRVDGADHVVYRIIISGRCYDLPARLARELFSERQLPDRVYAGMVTAGMRRREG